ncbi:alpha/beta hydrolase [Nonomuraea sp. FMUSA5-5]|uniref:Alpha/beta hydrolase n=1 Tax=Nonomuraea composti TaxID=2720023 RepID=A0ABX1B6X1_9ACTN|nr:alpha/beta hydrolase fold domain-containing protein [Nonomuraea sp. FMUSA5-5]NJP90918.1 alpha/beta hydrolase [Nonomuraea sp. FMUSA5-5]
MTDPYWDRLRTLYHEHLRLGADHPDARTPDPELAARLRAPREGEAEYAAPAARVRDVVIGPCTVRVYTPEADAIGRPLFVWCHGGAWAAGDLEGPEADATAREICTRADAVVVSVDYRLATDGVHYPIPLDDVVAAYLWAVDNAKDLGADPALITLGGASAGGNLAAGAALRVRDEGSPPPAALLLVYPCLHPELPPASPELRAVLDRMSPAAAFAPHVTTPIVENYLGTPITEATSYAMPGLADDLSGLPRTMIINSEYDGLRASGERFAQQLRDAGVEVVLDTVPDVDHGHLARPALPQLEQTYADMSRWVRG